MSKISDLAFRYLHRQLAASKDTPTQYTASAGTVRTAASAALVEADGYWKGAIVRWDGGANVGKFSSVLAFDAASDTLTFDEDLPAAVTAADTFTLFLGGLFASDQPVPGMLTSQPVNVTGFSIVYAAMLSGEGTGQINFLYHGGTGQTLSWTPPGESAGIAVDVSGLSTDDNVVLFGGGSSALQKSKFIRLQRTAAALPSSDQADDVDLILTMGSFLGAFVGAETDAGTTVYRPAAIENTGVGALYFAAVFCASPWASATATIIAAGGGIGIGDDTLLAASLVNWGAHGWVFNSTQNDLRYFFNRSGNTISILDPSGGMRGFTAANWADGDAIEPFPWFDIGLDAPGVGSAFEDPADENTAPSGVTFSCPRTAETGLPIGNLAPAALYTIWERFFIPAGFAPLDAGRADLHIYAEATE